MRTQTVVLDTSVIIDVLRNNDTALSFVESLAKQPGMSVVSLSELLAGARNRQDERTIERIVNDSRLLPVSETIARRAGEWLRHYSGSHGLDMPDALIAATAEHHGLPLATLNLKHFPMFPKLKRPY